MEDELFQQLFKCKKIITETLLKLPEQGEQKFYNARKIDDESEEFTVIVNRKGYLNPDKLTYQLTSRYGILVRIDMSGAPHESVETPHVHIFDEKHDNGRIAFALQDITDVSLLQDIYDSFIFFLSYNNIKAGDIDQSLF